MLNRQSHTGAPLKKIFKYHLFSLPRKPKNAFLPFFFFFLSRSLRFMRTQSAEEETLAINIYIKGS